MIVERDDAFADLLREIVWQETSCKVFRVSTGKQALRVVPQLRPDLLIVGFQLADMTGSVLYEQLHTMKELITLPTLLLSTQHFRVQDGSTPSFSIERSFDVDVLLQTIAALLGDDIWVE